MDDAESAFANFRLWQAVGLSASFAYGKVLCVSWRLLVAMGILFTATILYLVLEIKLKLSEQEAKRNSKGQAVLMPEVATWLPSVKPYDSDKDKWQLVKPTLPHHDKEDG